MAFAGWFGNRLARESVRCNAARVSFSQNITIEGKKYTTRFGTVTFSTEEKKNLEERAEEIVERLLSSGLANDLKAALKEAVIFTDHTPQFYSAYSQQPIGLPRSCGLSCFIDSNLFPDTQKAWLDTEWAKAIGAR